MNDPLLPFKVDDREEETSRTSSITRESPSGYCINTPHSSIARLITNDSVIHVTTPCKESRLNTTANLNEKRRKLIQRSHSAPSVFSDVKEAFLNPVHQRPPPRLTLSIVHQAFICLLLYIITGIAIYMISGNFKGHMTFKPIDALYFIVVTLCTIGYGDIVPNATFTKLFTSFYILVGFGFIDILLNGLVTYICDRQEAVLLSTVDENWFNSMVRTYMIDEQKGRMRIRIKVCLALGVVIVCLAIGTVTTHFLEKLNWVDSFYLSVTSVTTVGYGDYAFTTLAGRCFAIVWLLVSTLAVARAFLYLTELRIDKRNRRIAKWVLQKKITLRDLVAADLNNDGCISKSEFIIYKLKEMGKIAENDILQICNQFDLIDYDNSGKITLSDLMASD